MPSLPLHPSARGAAPSPALEVAPLDLLALLPCPLKVPLDLLFEEFGASHPGYRIRLEGNANHEGELLGRMARAESLDALPDAVLSPGLNPLFHGPFRRRFLDGGAFECLSPPEVSAGFRRLDLAGGEGGFAMLAMNPLVMIVDEQALGGRPAPRAIEELFDPIYAGSVAIRGNRDGSFCETLLLSVHVRHGASGVAALARATRHGWHPSQMVKAAGSGREDAPAVSVLPRFFAKTLAGRNGVRLVWPEDGAVVSPVTVLVKRARREPLAPLLDFLSGPEVGRASAGALFPSVRADVPDGVPEGAPFHWIGWDFVRRNDVGQVLAAVNATFRGHRAVPA